MERVSGLGGVFLHANDAASLAAWYRDVLGIPLIGNAECNNYYVDFELQAATDTSPRIIAVFAIFQAKAPLGPGRNECIVNLRVANLAKMLDQLRSKGITIDKHEEYDYGSFAWIKDPQGYSLELYEPR